VRARLAALLGGWRADRPTPVFKRTSRADTDAFMREDLTLDLGTGEDVPAVFVRPHGDGRYPAVLYCHAHGARYEIGARELTEGRPALLAPPYAAALTEAGFAALCVEMPTFGARAARTESALAKALLWRGETLFGLMLRELAGGLDHLARRPDVDAARIAAFGASMGATHAFWLAALDERIAAVAHMLSFADLETLITSGGHDLHGIYMTVPGLCREIRTGEIAGLVAPRPQLACVGALDPLTPPDAIAAAAHDAAAAYARSGAPDAWRLLTAVASGHLETPAMRGAVLDFLTRTLRPAPNQG
jgi:hypothetical protein